MMSNGEEKLIKILKDETCADEEVIGCSISNYGNRYICGAFNNSGCKKLEQCRRVRSVLARKMKEQ